jgi:glycine betaine/proline transport system permease protein
MDWLTEYKIPIGKGIEALVDLINKHAAWLFDLIAESLEWLIDGMVDVLQWFHPLALIALIAAFAFWLHRSWKLVVLVILSLLLIVNMGYWEPTLETLALVLCATFVCMLIGIPIGIACAHRPWLYTLIRPVLDLMQTIPTFVYLIPTLVLFGLGMVPGLISTVIFALPAPIRLTYLGVASVPQQLIDAGEAFGATKSQLRWKKEIPHALPTIMAGVSPCIMLSV